MSGIEIEVIKEAKRMEGTEDVMEVRTMKVYCHDNGDAKELSGSIRVDANKDALVKFLQSFIDELGDRKKVTKIDIDNSELWTNNAVTELVEEIEKAISRGDKIFFNKEDE